jgi:uncharacterized protein YukE
VFTALGRGHREIQETAMTMYGANPEQLAALGRTLSQQIEQINHVTATVDSVLHGTVWTGPAQARFSEEWNGSFKQALSRLNEAFDQAGRDCVLRAEQLQRVMGI